MAKVQRHYVREWRKFRGLTVEALAKAIGVNKGQMSRMETGERKITLESLELLAGALNTTQAALHSRPPEEGETLAEIYERIPPEDRDTAKRILEQLAKKK